MYTIEKTPPAPLEGHAGFFTGGYFSVRRDNKPVANFMFDHPEDKFQIYANDEQGAFRDAELFVSLMMEPCT